MNKDLDPSAVVMAPFYFKGMTKDNRLRNLSVYLGRNFPMSELVAGLETEFSPSNIEQVVSVLLKEPEVSAQIRGKVLQYGLVADAQVALYLSDG